MTEQGFRMMLSELGDPQVGTLDDGLTNEGDFVAGRLFGRFTSDAARNLLYGRDFGQMLDALGLVDANGAHFSQSADLRFTAGRVFERYLGTGSDSVAGANQGLGFYEFQELVRVSELGGLLKGAAVTLLAKSPELSLKSLKQRKKAGRRGRGRGRPEFDSSESEELSSDDVISVEGRTSEHKPYKTKSRNRMKKLVRRVRELDSLIGQYQEEVIAERALKFTLPEAYQQTTEAALMEHLKRMSAEREECLAAVSKNESQSSRRKRRARKNEQSGLKPYRSDFAPFLDTNPAYPVYPTR